MQCKRLAGNIFANCDPPAKSAKFSVAKISPYTACYVCIAVAMLRIYDIVSIGQTNTAHHTVQVDRELHLAPVAGRKNTERLRLLSFSLAR